MNERKWKVENLFLESILGVRDQGRKCKNTTGESRRQWMMSFISTGSFLEQRNPVRNGHSSAGEEHDILLYTYTYFDIHVFELKRDWKQFFKYRAEKTLTKHETMVFSFNFLPLFKLVLVLDMDKSFLSQVLSLPNSGLLLKDKLVCYWKILNFFFVRFLPVTKSVQFYLTCLVI